MIFPGGITVTELGLDHFLLDRHIDVAAVNASSAALRIILSRWRLHDE
jgi:hypothetical protein